MIIQKVLNLKKKSKRSRKNLPNSIFFIIEYFILLHVHNHYIKNSEWALSKCIQHRQLVVGLELISWLQVEEF